MKRLLCLGLVTLAAAFVGYWLIEQMRYRAMHTLPQGLQAFNVNNRPPQCARWRDSMPRTRDAKVFALYIAARKLWRSKYEWELTRAQTSRILADVSFAADKGDWGAKALLAHFYREGLGPLPENQVQVPDADKAVRITRTAVAAGQPWGFYDMGVAHEHGYGGAVYDDDIAWAYYLRAAELGSPDAQVALAEAYSEAKKFDYEEEMLRCAFAQGHGPAAYMLAMRQEVFGNHLEAAKLYQDGVRFGDEKSAASLRILFKSGYWVSQRERERLEALGIHPDSERARRYAAFGDALKRDPDLRFENLNIVLPLPPAPLPEWTGIDTALTVDAAGPPSY
jgi:uncharacterized protein